MTTTARIADADAEAVCLIRGSIGNGQTRHIDVGLLPEVCAGLTAISADLLVALARRSNLDPGTLLDRIELGIRERELA